MVLHMRCGAVPEVHNLGFGSFVPPSQTTYSAWGHLGSPGRAWFRSLLRASSTGARSGNLPLVSGSLVADKGGSGDPKRPVNRANTGTPDRMAPLEDAGKPCSGLSSWWLLSEVCTAGPAHAPHMPRRTWTGVLDRSISGGPCAAWAGRKFGSGGLAPEVLPRRLGPGSLAPEAWHRKFGPRSLAPEVWHLKFGPGSLAPGKLGPGSLAPEASPRNFRP